MRHLFVSFIIICTIISCQPKNRVFVEHQELSPNIEWLKSDKKTFKINVEDINIDYKLSLSFRYATGFQYKNAMVTLIEVSPSGEKNTTNHSLKVRKDNGDYIGEAGLDIWDSEHIINDSKKYSEKGVYTYTIEHNMPKDPLNYAMEIGMILDKKE